MKIFLDSNIIQHAATSYRTFDLHFGGAGPNEALVRKGVDHVVDKKPADAEVLRSEIAQMPRLAEMLKGMGASLITTRENLSEVRKAGRYRGEYFYRSEIAIATPPPEPYQLQMVPSWMNAGPTENQFHNFLDRLRHPRFLEFAKYAGAFHGSGVNYRQLSDAYFLWCAEVNQVDYFLTLDGNLQRAIERSTRLKFSAKVVSPIGLLNVLGVA